VTIEQEIRQAKGQIKAIEYQSDWEEKNGYYSLALANREELQALKRRLKILTLQRFPLIRLIYQLVETVEQKIVSKKYN
jgi:hypothetical protein